MKNHLVLNGHALLFSIALLTFPGTARSQGTAFTYQGRLTDNGQPANRAYDLRFAVYDSTNLPGTLITGPLTNSNVSVSNGLFTVTLDFGPGVFTGPARWLDIAVRTNGGSFVSLSPRQALAPAPYAITAATVVPGGLVAGTYGNAVAFTNAGNSFNGTHTGNGVGLTALNASALASGTVADARLSGNVALLNATNNFTATQIMLGNLGLGTNSPTARLHVNGQVRITGGAPAAGKVLTSDTSGMAAWSATRSSPQVVVVDAAGNGDFTSVSAALAAIAPSAAVPYVIEVRPGLYFDRIVMKSHVHLQGAGPDSTVVMFNMAGVVTSADFAVVRFTGLTNVAISGFTLTTPAYTNPAALQAAVGVYDIASSPLITNNRFVLLAGAQPTLAFPNPTIGVCSSTSAPVVCNCYFEEARAVDGISLDHASGTITQNTFSNHFHAVTLSQSSAQVLNNQMNAMGEAILIRPGSEATVGFNRFAGGGGGSRGILNQGEARILGNDFAGGQDYGIENTGEASILGNTLTGCAVEGIRSTGGTRTVIAGNLLANCSGAGNSALVLVNSTAVVSGNTLISNVFGDIQVGGTGTPFVSGNITPGGVRGGAALAGYGPAIVSTTTSSNLVLNAPGGTGIGTLNPAGVLHLVAPVGLPPAGLASQDNGLVLGLQATAGYKWIQSYGGALALNPQGNSVGIGTTNPATMLDVNGTITCVSLAQTSDREAKEHFAPVDTREVLTKVAALPITTWNFKGDAPRHLGPMAQDFFFAFNVGPDERHIAATDINGVALAAIQGLNEKLEEREAELQELKQIVAELKRLAEGRNPSPRNHDAN
jgi:hypothetical protein